MNSMQFPILTAEGKSSHSVGMGHRPSPGGEYCYHRYTMKGCSVGAPTFKLTLVATWEPESRKKTPYQTSTYDIRK